MKKVKKIIDLNDEKQRKKLLDTFNSFSTKGECYKYLGVSGNNQGIKYLKEICKNIGFNLDTYRIRRQKKKTCLICGKEFIVKYKNQRLCSRSCSGTYNNQNRTKESIEKLKNSLRKYYDSKPKKENIIKCHICGKSKCNKDGVCSYTKRFLESLKYFGFDVNTIGSELVFEEFERVKDILNNEYNDNKLSPSDLKEKYKYPKSFENITHILKRIGIKTRTLSESISNGYYTGNVKIPNIKMPNTFFRCGWHTTWDGKKIFYRSGYELKYAELLDELKIEYSVEKLRIAYYDTIKKRERIAIPDFILTKTNEIVEIKSRVTFRKQNIIDKFNSYEKLGYTPKLLLEGIMYTKDEINNLDDYNYIFSSI